MKTKSIITSAATFAVVALTTVPAFAGEEKEDAITMDKVPAAVKKALADYATEAEVKSVEKGDQDGKKVFEFAIEKNGRKFELALSPKGKFMGTEEDVELSAMPDAAQNALKAAAAGGKISGGEKAEDAHHKVTYEADVEKDGKKFEIAVDADGKVVSQESAGEEEKGKEGKEEKGKEKD
jgi:hypothetical protein